MKCCELLRHIELPDVTRLALEKPFGTDLATAKRDWATSRERY
ncbi:hypothetical protein [Nostocoides australiense]